jgi:hypothetical protein
VRVYRTHALAEGRKKESSDGMCWVFAFAVAGCGKFLLFMEIIRPHFNVNFQIKTDDVSLCGVQECNEGKWKEAAETAATAPSGILRTQATITRLQAAPAVPGQKSPLLVYFGALLSKGQLNGVESVEMSRIAISQNKPELVKNWMKDGKLTASEPLGDLLKEVWVSLCLTY